MFIARRLIVSAAEDVGLGNPGALPVAVAAQQAVHFVGMPEGRIPLAEATVYLATSQKSNSAYLAIDKALQDVRSSRDEPIPMHMRNAPTRLMKELGYAEGYRYPHDYPGHFVETENLPEKLRGRRYYEPGTLGAEKPMADRLIRWWGDKYAPPEDDSETRITNLVLGPLAFMIVRHVSDQAARSRSGNRLSVALWDEERRGGTYDHLNGELTVDCRPITNSYEFSSETFEDSRLLQATSHVEYAIASLMSTHTSSLVSAAATQPARSGT